MNHSFSIATQRRARMIAATALGFVLAATLPSTYSSASDDLIRFGIGIGTQLLRNEIERKRQQPPPRVREERDGGQQRSSTRRVAESPRVNVVLLLQAKLSELGFDPGPVDGDWGRKTENALKDWQASIGDPPTGKLTDPQRIALFGTTDPAGTKGGGIGMAQNAPGSAVTPLSHENQDSEVAAVRAAQPTAPAASWYGTLTCLTRNKPVTAEIEIILADRPDGNFDFDVEVNYPNSMQNGVWQASFIGENARDGTERKRFVRNDERGRLAPNQTEFGSFYLDTRADGTLIGTFEGGDCQTFTAEAASSLPYRYTPTKSAVEDGGSFWAAASKRDRCEIAIAWAGRLAQEYPGIDFYRSGGAENDWKKILLFGDDDFVPVFGQPFDTMSHDRRKTAHRFVTQECRSDPFTRDRLEPFMAAADRVLPDNPERQLTSDGYSSTVFAVRKIRTVRNMLNAAKAKSLTNLALDRSFSSIAAELTSLKSESTSRSAVLWPSEITEAGATIDAYLADAARSEAQKALEAITFATDDRDGLAKVRHAITSEKNGGFLSFLPSGERDGIRGRIDGFRKRFADNIAGPWKARAMAAPSDLVGVQEIEMLKAELSAEKALSDSEKHNYTNDLDIERDRRLVVLADARLAELPHFGSGQIGLEMGKNWAARMEADFQMYASHEAIDEAMSVFRLNRVRMLTASIEEFEASIATLPNSGSQQRADLLNRYLSMADDWRLPISLDYLFVAAGSETQTD